MTSRRKKILKELGLTPLWHIKSDTVKNDVAQAYLADENQYEDSSATITTDQKRFLEIQQMNWEQLKEAVTNCMACPLSQSRTHTVFGTGDKTADWLYIGEGPGAREDATGEPFVGQAGKLLDNMLLSIGLKRRHQVYITNMVKCRPPNNRNPEPYEIHQCNPYLVRQIALIKPKLIVALGKVAAQSLLNCNDNISELRGRLHECSGIPLVVTYHPAYLLRALPEKAKVWEDLCFAKATMQSLAL